MANWLGMPATAVSTYVARFLERGLVERRPNPDDGRSYVLLLGGFNGQVASFIFDASGNVVNAWLADAPMDSSTLLLPALASDIGLGKQKGDLRPQRDLVRPRGAGGVEVGT